MPRVTVFINAGGSPLDQDIFTLEVPSGMTIADFKGLVQAEKDVPAHMQSYYFNGQIILDETKTLEAVGVKDGEVLYMLIAQPEAQNSRREARRDGRRQGEQGHFDIETSRLRFAGNPQAREQLAASRPDLAAAVDDPVRFREIWLALKREEDEAYRRRQQKIEELNADPFNVEAQREIEEMIRQERVIDNLQHALENTPEVFVQVTMLYVHVEVNSHPVKAFVDSGAQATIMSPACAERCGIMRLIDKRFSGVAKGVGTANILGRVHSASIKIGDAMMECAFTVMEGKDVDMLLGLDMLKRFKAKIDLERNALVFSGVEVPFLPESEIPRWENNPLDEPTIAGPNGTEIGARSGAVRPAGSSAAGPSGTSGGPSSSTVMNPAPATATATANALGTTPPPAQQQSAGASPFPQSSIDQLLSLGFSREAVIRALTAADGNVEYAASLLLGMAD